MPSVYNKIVEQDCYTEKSKKKTLADTIKKCFFGRDAKISRPERMDSYNLLPEED